MEYPAYAIVDTIAIKAVRHEDGSVEVLRYLPKMDTFERDMRFYGALHLPGPDFYGWMGGEGTPLRGTVELVSEEEFKAYLAALRELHSSAESE